MNMAAASSTNHGSDSDALLQRAFLEVPADAISALEQCVAHEPSRAHAWTGLGIARARGGFFEEAIGHFQRALELAPGQVLSTAYLGVCQHMAGRDDDSLELLDYDGMIDVAQLLPQASEAELNEFNAELVAHVRSHPTLTWQLEGKATTGGSQTDELLFADAPEVIQRFNGALRAHLVQLLLGEDAGSAEICEPNWRLTAWGVSLRSGGYQHPHVHQAGMVSGVYYAQTPRFNGRQDAGALRFPRQLPWLPRRQGSSASVVRCVVPRAGMLVTFPSYFWHETVPFESDVERVSIAFDVLPPPAQD